MQSSRSLVVIGYRRIRWACNSRVPGSYGDGAAALVLLESGIPLHPVVGQQGMLVLGGLLLALGTLWLLLLGQLLRTLLRAASSPLQEVSRQRAAVAEPFAGPFVAPLRAAADTLQQSSNGLKTTTSSACRL